jgi:hypothetical protein
LLRAIRISPPVVSTMMTATRRSVLSSLLTIAIPTIIITALLLSTCMLLSTFGAFSFLFGLIHKQTEINILSPHVRFTVHLLLGRIVLIDGFHVFRFRSEQSAVCGFKYDILIEYVSLYNQTDVAIVKYASFS